MVIDNKQLHPQYVPIIRPPAGVINEYFYAVPGASDYVISDYGRLYKKTENNSYHKVKMTTQNGEDAYPIQFDAEDDTKIVPVRKIMAMTFFPDEKGIYLKNPVFGLYADPVKRWSLYNLHVLKGKNDITEYIMSKIERREPNYDDSQKHIEFKNRPELDMPFRKYINRMWSNMRSRASNPGTKKRFPQYADTTIDPELMESSKLLGQWCLDTYYDYPEKLEVDKDILGLGETNRYQIGLIALVPNHLNKIFIRGKSELGYGISEKVNAKGKKFYKIMGASFEYDGYKPEDKCCDTYIEALQTARKMKADYLRRIAVKERADGYLPNFIVNAIEKWANRCELGMIKMWEPSKETLRKMDII